MKKKIFEVNFIVSRALFRVAQAKQTKLKVFSPDFVEMATFLECKFFSVFSKIFFFQNFLHVFFFKLEKNYQIVNMKISKIANGAKYRMDEKFKNLLIFGILIVFQIKKKI